MKRALQSPQWRPVVPPHLGFGDVINDYCACHAIKPDVKSLCEAIIVAVDNGNLMIRVCVCVCVVIHILLCM